MYVANGPVATRPVVSLATRSRGTELAVEETLSPRMRQLLDAALVVVSDAGLRGLTHRAVDREAGLPEGSCSAYLRTRHALTTALGEYVAEHLAADVHELTDVLADCPG